MDPGELVAPARAAGWPRENPGPADVARASPRLDPNDRAEAHQPPAASATRPRGSDFDRQREVSFQPAPTVIASAISWVSQAATSPSVRPFAKLRRCVSIPL